MKKFYVSWSIINSYHGFIEVEDEGDTINKMQNMSPDELIVLAEHEDGEQIDIGEIVEEN